MVLRLLLVSWLFVLLNSLGFELLDCCGWGFINEELLFCRELLDVEDFVFYFELVEDLLVDGFLMGWFVMLV